MSMPSIAPAPVPGGGDDAAVDLDVEVLRLIAEGCPVVQIAQRLQLTLGTTKKHVERVYARIGCQTRQAQAADHVARHGLELAPEHAPTLTERQAQVLNLIAEGHTKRRDRPPARGGRVQHQVPHLQPLHPHRRAQPRPGHPLPHATTRRPRQRSPH